MLPVQVAQDLAAQAARAAAARPAEAANEQEVEMGPAENSKVEEDEGDVNMGPAENSKVEEDEGDVNMGPAENSKVEEDGTDVAAGGDGRPDGAPSQEEEDANPTTPFLSEAMTLLADDSAGYLDTTSLVDLLQDQPFSLEAQVPRSLLRRRIVFCFPMQGWSLETVTKCQRDGHGFLVHLDDTGSTPEDILFLDLDMLVSSPEMGSGEHTGSWGLLGTVPHAAAV